MGVSTGTQIKFYTADKQLVTKHYLEDRADDYIYNGLVCDGGATFAPEFFGSFTDEEKEIMKIYFDEESLSVSEEYATATENIQLPIKLIPIWEKIRSSISESFYSSFNDYHNLIISDYTAINETFERYNNTKNSLFSKAKLSVPNLQPLKSESNIKDMVWTATWKMDSVSKIIALLIVAKDNNMLVEITAIDG